MIYDFSNQFNLKKSKKRQKKLISVNILISKTPIRKSFISNDKQ